MLNKKASLETHEILELILAAAGIIILVILLYQLFMPKFDKNEESAKSFFEQLKKEIARADSGEIGEFKIWGNANIFLLYFGNQRTFLYPLDNSIALTIQPHDKNYVCICYWETKEKYNCKSCMSLKAPANIYWHDEYGKWYLPDEKSVKIQKNSGEYTFFYGEIPGRGVFQFTGYKDTRNIPLYIKYEEGWKWSYDNIHWKLSSEKKFETGMFPKATLDNDGLEVVSAIKDKNYEEGREILLKTYKAVEF